MPSATRTFRTMANEIPDSALEPWYRTGKQMQEGTFDQGLFESLTKAEKLLALEMAFGLDVLNFDTPQETTGTVSVPNDFLNELARRAADTDE